MQILPSECIAEVLKHVHSGVSNSWLSNVSLSCRLFKGILSVPYAWKDIPVVFPTKTQPHVNSPTLCAALSGSENIIVRADVWTDYLNHNWGKVASIRLVIGSVHGCLNVAVLLSMISVPMVTLSAECSQIPNYEGTSSITLDRLPTSLDNVTRKMAAIENNVNKRTTEYMHVEKETMKTVTGMDSCGAVTALLFCNMCRYKRVSIDDGSVSLVDSALGVTASSLLEWRQLDLKTNVCTAITVRRADLVAVFLYALASKTVSVGHMTSTVASYTEDWILWCMPKGVVPQKHVDVCIDVKLCNIHDFIHLLNFFHTLSPLLRSLTMKIHRMKNSIFDTDEAWASVDKTYMQRVEHNFQGVATNFDVLLPCHHGYCNTGNTFAVDCNDCVRYTSQQNENLGNVQYVKT